MNQRLVSNQARNFSQFASQPDNFKRKKNLFDLSHDHKTTFSMGQLIPFLTVETLPGDDFRIDYEILCRFAPLYLPIMHRCDMTINYFYVPWRIIWSDWSKYITQSEDLLTPYYDQPLAANVSSGTKRYMLVNYMGFPSRLFTPTVDTISVSAGPVAAYWKIWNEYYRNSQIQTEVEIPLSSGENDITGWSLYFGDAPLFVAYKLWNRDYYTSALPTPQIGVEVLVPIANDNYDIPGGTYGPGDVKGPYRWLTNLTHTPVSDGDLGIDAVSTGIAGGTAGSAGDLVYLDIQETSAPLRDFRLAARMLEFLERLMRTGQRYRDFLKGHFGVDPDPGTIDLPVYIGGSKGRVVISEVMSTAETVDVPVGAYAGQALAIERGKSQVKYFCKEHGFIIGIINIQPKSSYFQGLSKMWTRGVGLPLTNPGNVYDYAFEEFAGIGDQEILMKELRLDLGTTPANVAHNEDVFGYIPRYSDYRYMNDIVSAEMRTIWLSFHLSRLFVTGQVPADALTEPVLNSEFVSCIPRIDDVFQVGGAQEHEIYAHIFNNVQVWRSLPKFGIPTL